MSEIPRLLAEQAARDGMSIAGAFEDIAEFGEPNCFKMTLACTASGMMVREQFFYMGTGQRNIGAVLCLVVATAEKHLPTRQRFIRLVGSEARYKVYERISQKLDG
ncbi:hypothetical protein [Catelliglobosispora koreensis]|uniref:hypothetical protein n=1 Tax=Catelliglobosispora koreensis TaxID=129052 RepID=UPI0003680DD3|nr:hypothetical protein [Catelliglobosispora koreensis]